MDEWRKYSGLKKLLAISGLFVSSCVTSETTFGDISVAPPDYEIKIQANDVARRFEIELSSNSNETLCFDAQWWPQDNGVWLGEAGVFKLITPSGVIEPTIGNPGICVGAGCRVKILPGESVSTKLNYSNFGNEDEIAAIPSKNLVYDLSLWYCPK